MNRVAGSSIAAAPLGAVLTWLWNGFVKDPAMPAEVAASLGAIITPMIAWAVSWLPEPKPKPDA